MIDCDFSLFEDLDSKDEHYLKKELYHKIQTDIRIFEFLESGSLDGIWYWDLENPENEWMSPKFWTTLGFNPLEKKHSSSEWQNLIHPEDRIIATENFIKHCKDPEHPYDQIVRYLHKNGSTVWVRCRGLAIRNEEGKAIRMLGAHLDLTQVKHYEKDLKESLWRFKALFDQGPFGVAYHKMIYDEDGLPIDYYFIDANQSYQVLTGVNPIGKKAKEAFPGIENDPFDWIGTFGKVARDGETVRFEQYLSVNERWYDCVAYQYKKDHFIAMFNEVTKQKKIERALIESEKKHTAMIENISDVIETITTEGIVTYVSPNVFDFFGWSSDELIGKSALTHFCSREITPLIERFKNLQTQNEDTFTLECSYTCKDGRLKTVMLTAKNMVEDDRLRSILLNFHDITDRVEAEREINESRERFSQISETVEEVFYLVNPENSEMLYVNPAYEKIWGKTLKSLYDNPLSFLDSVHVDEKEYISKAFEMGLRTGIFNEEYRVVRPDGDIRWVRSRALPVKNKQGHVYRHTGTAVDITEYKLAQQKLNDNLKDLLESQRIAKVGTWRLDVHTNEVVWSEELYKMYGFDPKKPVPPYTEHMKLFTSESWGRLSQALEKTRSEGIPYELELMTVTKSGANGWMWVRGEAERNHLGEIVSIWGAAQDITLYKNVEMDLIKAKEAAEAASIAKSQFLSNMSHEIRTPMNGFLGTLQLISESNLSEEQEELVQIATQSAKSLLSLVNDILEYSRIESNKLTLKKEVFDPSSVIMEVVKLFKNSADSAGLKFNVDFSSDIPNLLVGDAFRLKQVLSNLLGNAIKFTSKGKIDLEVKAISQMSLTELYLMFVVKDTGIGIPRENQKSIFTRFSQVDASNTRNYGGSGLGLSIAKGIVEKMGGEIWFTSDENEGSAFYFTCKFEIADLSNTSENQKNVKQFSSKEDVSILLVEDDEVSRLIMGKFAKKNNWSIEYATNGKEALKYIFEGDFDLILMDIQMPEMNGYEATEIIRRIESRKKRKTPIIAMTAFATEGHTEKCLLAGMDDYINKPIDFNELQKLVVKWSGK